MSECTATFNTLSLMIFRCWTDHQGNSVTRCATGIIPGSDLEALRYHRLSIVFRETSIVIHCSFIKPVMKESYALIH
jgi:hypothetical protein